MGRPPTAPDSSPARCRTGLHQRPSWKAARELPCPQCENAALAGLAADIVTAVEPTLRVDQVTAALEAAVPSWSQRRRVVDQLAADPGVLTDCRSATPLPLARFLTRLSPPGRRRSRCRAAPHAACPVRCPTGAATSASAPAATATPPRPPAPAAGSCDRCRLALPRGIRCAPTAAAPTRPGGIAAMPAASRARSLPARAGSPAAAAATSGPATPATAVGPTRSSSRPPMASGSAAAAISTPNAAATVAARSA
jgi:hypothetical protein